MSETEVNAGSEGAPAGDALPGTALSENTISASTAQDGMVDVVDTAVQQHITVGMRLAAERETKQWSIGYVASQLNLAPRQIQALETDNYAALPGLVSVRGFIRSYAKLLKIDAGPLVAMIVDVQVAPIPQLEPRRSLSPMPFADNLLMSTADRRSPKAVLAVIVLLALAALVIAVEWGGGWAAVSQLMSAQVKDGATAPVASPAAPIADAASSADAATVPDPTATGPSMAVSTLPEVATNQSASSEAASKGAVAPELKARPKTDQAVPEVAATRMPVTEKKPVADKPAAGTTKNQLVFTVREDSWIEVKGSSGALLARLVKGGSTESVDVSEPVALVLGNAAGVDVSFRGNPIDIKTDAKSNVARLNLK